MKTEAEIKVIARVIVGRILSDTMTDFPKVKRAVDNITPKIWIDYLAALIEETQEILIDKFGVK